VLGLIVVVPGWFIAVIADGIAIQLPRWIPFSRLLLALFAGVLAAGWFIAAIGSGIHPLVIFGSIPIVSVFALLAASALSSPHAQADDPLADHYPRTTWRLTDPQLWKWGVWRAEIKSVPPGIDGFGDHRLVEEYVRGLISDWSFRSGYFGCRVLRVFPVSPRTTCPLPFVPEWRKVYRVTLGVGEVLEHGWMCFGDGFAEFQLEANARMSAIPLMANVQTQVISGKSPEAENAEPKEDRERTPTLAGPHPLWDRWFDG